MNLNNNKQNKKVKKSLHYIKTSLISYDILNHNDIMLGELRKQRVGYYFHWCFIPIPTKRFGDLWFTNKSLKEISVKISELYKTVNSKQDI